MRRVKKSMSIFMIIISLLVLSVLSLMLAGCDQKMVCSPPNVMIGNSCCLDADNNQICDTWEETEEEPEIVSTEPEPETESEGPDEYELFAETFAETWNRKSYNALRNLFVDDFSKRFSGPEFNFLARKVDAKLGIDGITLTGVDEDTATYSLLIGGRTETVTADIDETDDGMKHDVFYFFEELDADSACGSDEECFMSFAKISGDRNYCDKAGKLKGECVASFGVADSMIVKIDNCLEITEMYSRADCLTRLAVNENDVEPCWQVTHDKQRFECMGSVAASRDDYLVCADFVSSHGSAGTRLQHAYCIQGYVRETSDTRACDEIDRRSDVVLGAMQENCYKLNFP